MKRALLLVLAACGSHPRAVSTGPAKLEPPPPPRAADTSAELSPALKPLAWWLGDWQGPQGAMHVRAAGGAVFGVTISGGTFEVLVVDDAPGPGPADGVVRLSVIANGKTRVDYTANAQADARIAFKPDTADVPGVQLGRDGDKLALAIAHDGAVFDRTDSAPAESVADADRAFSADVGKRGTPAWVDAFDAQGGMLRKTGRIEGADAIGKAMGPLLDSGTLAWAPIASGVDGDLGWSVGKATFTGKDPSDHWQSSYITIWKKQPHGGGWKVLFDTGAVTNE